MTEMNRLKVWGGSYGRGRCIVAAPTKKRAVEILNTIMRMSRYEFDQMWAETGNKTELAIAALEGVWKSEDLLSNSYERIA